jgi:acetyltransferase-like isoleucine patch superfamily enzyme
MDLKKIARIIKANPSIKKLVHRMIIPKNQARPRLWVKWFINPFIHKKGRNTLIRRRTRMDVLPFEVFRIGNDSTIEDFCTVNNGVGPVVIGDRTRIGLGSVLIGPVTIGNDVRLAQNVVMSGLNHSYQDVNLPISRQPVTTKPIAIMDETWVGANVFVAAGVTIGKHCVVAGGSVVTKDIPDYSVAAGNPARIIRKYNPASGEWERTN